MSLSDLTPEQLEAFLAKPSLDPPDNVKPQLVNPPNDNALAMGVAITCLSISSILILLRTYSRVFVLKLIGTVAYALFVAYIYCVFRFVNNVGFFVHQWNIPYGKLPEFLYIILIGSNFYALGIMLIKIAILLEWLHIFVPTGTRNLFFWSCWAVLVFNTAYYIANLVAIDLTCIPFRAIWDITITDKQCLDQKALNTSAAVINVVSDLAILGLVQMVIWKLHMPKNRKVGISLIFAAGIFGCVAGIARLVVNVRYQQDEDVTYSVSSVIMWAIGEQTSGLIVFCVPAVPKVFSSKTGVPSRVASALRSFTAILSGGSSKSASKDGSQHPPEAGTIGSAAGSYHKMADHQVPLQLLHTNKSQQLSESTEHLQSIGTTTGSTPDDAIMRTTRIVSTIRDDDNGAQMANEGHRRQHPWIGA